MEMKNSSYPYGTDTMATVTEDQLTVDQKINVDLLRAQRRCASRCEELRDVIVEFLELGVEDFAWKIKDEEDGGWSGPRVKRFQRLIERAKDIKEGKA